MAEENPSNVNPEEQGQDQSAPPVSGAGEEKQMNPEAQAALANQPKEEAKAEAPKAAPTKIGKEKAAAKSNKKFLLGCAGGLIVLFVLFVFLMVLVISKQGAGSPVLNAFGLDPGQLKRFLLNFIGLSFGFLALLFFVLMIIGIFKTASAKKDDKDKRKRGLVMTFFNAISMFLILLVWLFLFNFINNLQIAAERVVAEIVVVEPENLDNLEAPTEITYSAINVAKALQNSALQIESMNWDLDGNGSYETPVGADPEVSRLYTRREVVNVGLQVNVAGEDTPRVYTKLINIGEALFSIDPETGTAPQEIQFDASSLVGADQKISSADWDFDGDGKYDTQGKELRPSYVYEQIGTYEIHLRIVDENNVVENYYRNIEIRQSDVPLLAAEITATPGLEGTLPFQVRFDGSQSTSLKGSIVNYEWDFGDGAALQTGRSVSHVYNKSGEYTVRLTVREDTGKEATSTAQVVVSDITSAPQAKIEVNLELDEDGTLRGELPLVVSFDAEDSTDSDGDIVDYEWDFDGDGEQDSSGQKVSHTFDAVGLVQVGLLVRDATGQEGTATLAVEVNEPGTKAVISANPQEGSAPLLVQFDGSGSTAFEGNIVSYEWDFGDGSAPTITGATVTHKYDVVGTYDVKLKVVTDSSETAETTQQVFVREVPLRACFTPSRTTGAAPLTVAFDPQCSTGNAESFSWNFGDGDESTARKPNHTFNNAGEYTVTLEVADDKNNVSIFTDTITAE